MRRKRIFFKVSNVVISTVSDIFVCCKFATHENNKKVAVIEWQPLLKFKIIYQLNFLKFLFHYFVRHSFQYLIDVFIKIKQSFARLNVVNLHFQDSTLLLNVEEQPLGTWPRFAGSPLRFSGWFFDSLAETLVQVKYVSPRICQRLRQVYF